MLLFVILSWQIEEKYGAFRVAFIFFWSAIGGELLNQLSDFSSSASLRTARSGLFWPILLCIMLVGSYKV